MYKYIRKIFLIIFSIVILFIAYPNSVIAGNYDGTVEASKKSLSQLKGDAVGMTVGFTTGVSGETLGQFKEADHMYCIQHKDESESGRYVIDAYIEIKGNIATGTYLRGANSAIKSKDSTWVWNNQVSSKFKVQNQNKLQDLIKDKSRKEKLLLDKTWPNGKKYSKITRTETSSSNMILGYLMNAESYYKGYGNDMIRDRAIHWWYSNNWFSKIGNKIGLYNRWDSSYNLGNVSSSDKNKINSFIQNAKKFAKNNANINCVPEISATNTKIYCKDKVAGPFKVKFNGTIKSVKVFDANNKDITSKIRISTDKAGKKVVKPTNIKSGKKYYITNKSNALMKSLKIKLKDNKVYTSRIWFIERADEVDAQRLITVQGGTQKVKGAEITINIVDGNPKGTLTIYKTDDYDKSINLQAGIRIKTSKGWLQNLKPPYRYDAKWGAKDTLYYTYDEGKREFKDLEYGTYHIYEVKAPSGYDLTKQKNYYKGKDGNDDVEWVDLGTVKINKNNSNVTFTATNTKVISISGYVWVDTVQGDSKIVDSNNLFDENETRVAGVTVRLMKKGDIPQEVASTITGENGEYKFTDIISKQELQNHYIEYNYSGTVYKNYIPVEFNAEKANQIVENGSRALVNSMPTYDKDFVGIANTYMGISTNTNTDSDDDIYNEDIDDDDTDDDVNNNENNDDEDYYQYDDSEPDDENNGNESDYGEDVFLDEDILINDNPTNNDNTDNNNDDNNIDNDNDDINNNNNDNNDNNTNTDNTETIVTNEDKDSEDKMERIYGLADYGYLFEELYNSETNTLENINLGIKQIHKPAYSITENLATVKITMKGFTYTYVYGGEGGESRIYAPQVTYQGRNDITAYKHSFYPSDIIYRSDNKSEELNVEVRYRIDITNTETMNLESKYVEQALYLRQLVNNFDADRYTLLADDNWTAGEVTIDSNGKKKQTAIINRGYLENEVKYSIQNGILPNNTITAYINFSVNHDAILDILNHPDGIAEEFPTQAVATGYHKYTRNDFSWENRILKNQTHYSEDDERNSEAPYLIFKLGPDRTISGKVFEDKVVTDNGEKLGNGTNEEGENAVKGVKVELLDASKDENIDITNLSVSNLYTAEGNELEPRTAVSKTAIVDTDENGNFALKGIVPGYYVIRYTYGDGTQEYTDSKGNKISVDVESKIRNSDGQEKTVLAKDYKSTIVSSQVARNALENSNENTNTWLRRLEDTNYSVAIDSLNERKDLNEDTEDNIIDDTKENIKENNKVLIDAGTAKMFLSIENTDTEIKEIEITKDENGKDKQKEEFKNEIKGINLGIIEQPKQQAKIEKVITYVTLTNSQNNVVFDGNPETTTMQGVSDLDNQKNGGSTYVRAEVLEDIIYSSKLELDYEIKVTNVSDVNYYEDNYYLYGEKNNAHEITLKVNEVTDYLDEGVKYLPEKSDKDRINSKITTLKLDDRKTQVLKLDKWEGVLFTNKSNDTTRKTTDKIGIVVERTLSRADKDMEIINEAEITGIKHATETGDTEEEKLKIAPSEVHTNGRVRVVTSITPPTGENKQLVVYYAIAGIVALAILSAGIVIIKKKIK